MPVSLNLSRYLPVDAAPRLKAYKYAGEDRSYLYIYFWKPLCVKLVTYLPMNLAANVITVTALALVLIAHCLFAYYMPDLTSPPHGEEQPPTWIFYYAAISLLLYQLLDNMDGHQARRTSSGSPLGLLMDHGCDALNTCVGSLSAASALSMGPTWKTWSALMIAVVVFFANTLEEYYRGALILPVVNGANEGIVLVVVSYILSGIYGPDMWLQTYRVPAVYVPSQVTAFLKTPLLQLGEGLDLETGDIVFQLNTVLLSLMIFSGIMCTFGNVYQLWVATRKKKGDREHGAKYGVSWLCSELPFFHSLTRAFPLVGISVLANLWFYYSPKDVFHKHPRIYCWTAGLLFTKLSIHLMIAHICSMEFHPFRRTLVPFFAIGMHWFLSAFVGAQNIQFGLGQNLGLFDDEELLLFEFFTLSCIAFLHLAFNAILETKEALGVPVWTVAKKKIS